MGATTHFFPAPKGSWETTSIKVFPHCLTCLNKIAFCHEMKFLSRVTIFLLSCQNVWITYQFLAFWRHFSKVHYREIFSPWCESGLSLTKRPVSRWAEHRKKETKKRRFVSNLLASMKSCRELSCLHTHVISRMCTAWRMRADLSKNSRLFHKCCIVHRIKKYVFFDILELFSMYHQFLHGSFDC